MVRQWLLLNWKQGTSSISGTPSTSSSQALNLISGGVGECAKLCRCTEFVAPAVVRFVEHRGGYNVACGCSGGAHIEALLDIFVAEAQVAGCNGNP